MSETRPRILFVNHTAQISGPSHSLLHLIPYLRRRYELALLLPESGPLSERMAQEQIPAFIIPGLRISTLGSIYSLLRREKFNLVYGNNPSSCSRNALIASRLACIPFIWHFRGIKNHWGWKKGIYLRAADRVVAVSQACAQPLYRFYPREKIHIIYNGVELKDYQIDHRRAHRLVREQNGLPADAEVILAVSHLRRRKGQAEAVAALERLVHDRPAAYLLFAGALNREPAYTAEVREQIRRAGLEGRVRFLGLREDIPLLLAGADLFMHTSTKEAHPRAVIEAMAAGLPVAAFAVAGVSETVDDGMTGFLLPYGDVAGLAVAACRLLEEPDLAARMGAAGRRRAAQSFTGEGTARKVEELIGEVLAGREKREEQPSSRDQISS